MEALCQELARDWSHLVSTHGVAQLAVLLLCVGAGGFSLDRSFRKSREKDRLLDQGL